MKKLNYLITAILIIASLVFNTGCSESGCTDSDSINYNANATEDDGSCQYESQIVFYYGEATATALVNADVTTLTYFVEGSIVGSTAADIYWEGETPQCNQEGFITTTIDLGGDKTKTVNYQVKDQNETEIWAGTITVNANTCLAFELVI